jgi:hypothetical protein
MKPLNIPNIQDFYPDSPDYGELSERAVQQEVLRRISAEQNKGLKDRAEIQAELAMYKAQNQIDQMKSEANRSFWNDIGSAALGTAASFIPTPYSGFGSTGGPGDTFNAGSVSKFGDVVRNPMDDIRAAGIEINGPLRDGQVF